MNFICPFPCSVTSMCCLYPRYLIDRAAVKSCNSYPKLWPTAECSIFWESDWFGFREMHMSLFQSRFTVLDSFGWSAYVAHFQIESPPWIPQDVYAAHSLAGSLSWLERHHSSAESQSWIPQDMYATYSHPCQVTILSFLNAYAVHSLPLSLLCRSVMMNWAWHKYLSPLLLPPKLLSLHIFQHRPNLFTMLGPWGFIYL